MPRGRARAEVTCGTQAGYRRHQLDGAPCCVKCRRAHARYARRRYRELVEEPATTASEHGTTRGYRNGCRCYWCRRAFAKMTFERRNPERAGEWEYRFEEEAAGG
jgi:hypothetical protein